MSASALLEVHGLVVRYGEVEAVRGVALRVAAGRITTVIGPNGAGKTTLLGAIAGLLPTAAGRVLLDGADITGAAPEENVARGLSLVAERRELFGGMSVDDNLELGAYALGKRSVTARDSSTLSPALPLPGEAAEYDRGSSTLSPALPLPGGGSKAKGRRQERREREALRDEVFRIFPRLAERRRQRAETLSGGERQMLALGRALMSWPRVLLLDEPSLGLAPKVVREIFEVVVDLRRRGVGILLVEQNARAALQVADDAYVLEGGEVTLSGEAVELARDPSVVESYLGLAKRPGSGP